MPVSALPQPLTMPQDGTCFRSHTFSGNPPPLGAGRGSAILAPDREETRLELEAANQSSTEVAKPVLKRPTQLEFAASHKRPRVVAARIATRFSLPPATFTLHPAPCTLHPAPCTVRRSPCTLHHSPFTLHHSTFTIRSSPCSIHPSPCTLHPSPFTLHHAPFTLDSPPFTLHPAPFTLHPAPCTLHPGPPPGVLHPSSLDPRF